MGSAPATAHIPLYQHAEAEVFLRQLLNKTASPSINAPVSETVRQILEEVRQEGDGAISRINKRLQDPEPKRLTASSLQQAENQLAPETKAVLEKAAGYIQAYAEAVLKPFQSPITLQHEGFSVGMDFRPVERVACYVPSGRYPLPSTALMTAITAQVSGVKAVAIFTPRPQPEILYAAKLAGVEEVYQLGGAQAIAAAAYGTETIIPVSMVVGPGNAYVTEAKRQLQGTIGIDMLAGPSELGILADGSANPAWIAWDLLAQAEHDPDARVYLVTDSLSLALQVQQAVTEHLQSVSLPDFVTSKSLANSALLVLPSIQTCIEALNQIAPEHLELFAENAVALKPKLVNYGALFIGEHTPVPYGDYMAGPNHTLPTGRTARFCGALSPLTFLRPQSWVHASAKAMHLAVGVEQFARLEGLTAHAEASKARQK